MHVSKRIATALVALAIVLGGFSVMPPQRALAGSFNAPVLLVHGYDPNATVNCNWHPEFGTIKDYFNGQGYTNTRTLGFYNSDFNCDNWSMRSESYHCNGWYDSGSNDGTVNEDIRHLSCLLAWYIWDGWTQYGTYVAVVAHSMGGILIRQAMNDTPYVGAFPPYLKITDVVTAGTPHQGLAQGAAGVYEHAGCPGNCLQVAQMENTDPLMSNMNSTSVRGGFGRNPQGAGGTDWTTMSSDFDDVLGNACDPTTLHSLGAPAGLTYGSCGLMPGATHFVLYPGPNPTYLHGGYLTDLVTTWTANEEYSDNNGVNWVWASNSEHSIFTMYEAILYSSW